MEPQQASDNVADPEAPEPESTDVLEGARRGSSDVVEAARDRLQGWFATEVRDRPGGFLVDLASLVAVAWLLWWLADNDGGLRNDQLWQPSLFVLLLTPLMAREWSRSPRPVRILLVWLPLGALVSFAFAVDRSRFVGDALTFGMVPGMVLASSRLARRAWTSHAVLAIVVIGFLSWSWLAGLKWWGWSDLGLQPRWELLSWRNQSGILTAGFGAWLAGICLAGRRSPALVAGGATGLAMAGAWLSSSRAAILFGVFGLLVVAWLAVASRDASERRGAALSVAGRLAGIGGATVALVLALQLMLPASASTPLESRGTETVSGNAITRTKHWEAATGMFLNRPLTGQGIGSYRAINARFNPPDGRLTAAAHSAWFEGFGEGGLVFGLPLLGLAGFAAAGVLRLPGRTEDEDDEGFGFRRASLFGAAGAAAAVVSHASIDFDFRYASVLGLAAVACGFVLERWSATSSGGDLGGPDVPPAALPAALPVVAMLAPVALLALGQWGALAERGGSGSIADLAPMEVATATPPWNTAGRIFASQLLADQGELEAALVAAEGPVAWNPGDPSAQMNLARLRYQQGELTGDELLSMLELPPTTLNQWPRTAAALLEGGDLREAELAARQAIDFFPTYEVWGIEGNVAQAWQVLIEIGTRAQGCQEGEVLLAQASDQGFDASGLVIEALEEWFRDELCPAA